MAENDQTPPDPNGQSDKSTVPDEPGKSGQTNQQQVDDLPEKFKGKSAADIAKSYLELERKIGENSKSVETTRNQLKEWEALGQVIQSDPNLKKAIQDKINEIAGKKPDQPKVDDIRIATTDRIVEDFERVSGIASLDGEEKTKIQQKIGQEVASMVDPSGKLNFQEAWDKIPANMLPTYLKKAYKVVKADMTDPEKAKYQALLEVQQNREAGTGNMSFSGVKARDLELTQEEKEVARKMHIPEDRYLKNKKAILEGN